ncbi:tetratricopeptide repeat protein 9C-like [Diadema antillarum]|uniref:tetratricopeptide repeat protein 9C-like n=1 Tax=Diadema antillarum TaxID=105358 RepID=UPI003A8702CF
MAEGGSSSAIVATDFPSPLERISKAEGYKSMGNELYKGKNYKAAIGKYHRALLQLKDLDLSAKRKEMRSVFGVQGSSAEEQTTPPVPKELLDQAAALETSCLNNLAACLLQQPEPNYAKVEHYCCRVLANSPSNEKALYRKGVALYHMRDYEGAFQSLSLAQKLSSTDANVKRYLQLCETAMNKQAKEERTRYRGMFDKMAAQGDH